MKNSDNVNVLPQKRSTADNPKDLEPVLKTVRGLTELSLDEKNTLEEMIKSENESVLKIVDQCQNNEELSQKLTDLVRAAPNGVAALDTSTPGSPAPMNTAADSACSTPTPAAGAQPMALTPDASSAEQEMESKEGEAAEPEDEFTSALKIMQAAGKPATVKSAVAAILKMLQNLQKRPEETRSRKLNMDNILIKKFILAVTGALGFMKAVGFQEMEAGKKKYLCVEEEQAKSEEFKLRLVRALAALTGAKEKAKAPVESKPRIKCGGGCGFWGDPKQDNYCSVCFKKKHLGIKAPDKEEERVKCVGKCGFYGSSKFKGYCSVCYKKEFPEEKMWKGKLRRALRKLKAVRIFKMGVTERPVQTDPKKCWHCRRKIGLFGIECRCGYLFCGNHRYPDQHDCAFDHRKLHRSNLRRDNQQVRNEKFDQI